MVAASTQGAADGEQRPSADDVLIDASSHGVRVIAVKLSLPPDDKCNRLSGGYPSVTSEYFIHCPSNRNCRSPDEKNLAPNCQFIHSAFSLFHAITQ
jgi:hypothetical protein